ncbi:MAG: histidinol-phosphatase [Tannerella sp.]|nr:histidinol-phosphatase [Tannerella sp.]
MNRHSNFHSHCIFCDGRAEPEEFVKSAIEKNFRAYGFSSHSPLPFETYWNMNKNRMTAYIEEANRLKIKYKGVIELYTGLEIDYLDKTYNASIPYFRDLPLDFRISSIHFIPWQLPLLEENMLCIDGPYKDFEDGLNNHCGGSIRRMTEMYFDASMQMVEAGCFDIVGHIDKISYNGCRHPDFDINASWFQKPFLELLDFVAEKGLAVEVNTKYMGRYRQTFPHIESFKELYNREIPVMVNSDCHYPELVNDGREETIELLLAAGFRSLRELADGKWQDIDIRHFFRKRKRRSEERSNPET